MKLRIQNAAIEIKGEPLLQKINFEIKDNDHTAIVGKNGAGKTTLLKAIINNDIFTEGIEEEKFEIERIGSFKIGYLEQIKINENRTLIEELTSSFQEILNLEKKIANLENNLTNEKNIIEYNNAYEQYKILGGFSYKKQIEIMIQKFKFQESDKNKKINLFSGGEKMKITFMKLLLLEPDLLILDEPTNHLDITTIEWLEDYLKNYKKALLIVSHDRMFLDNIVNHIYDIECGELVRYVGNYTQFTNSKKERYEKLNSDYEYQQKEIKRLYSLYERFRAKPSKARMALSKLKQIEHMDLLKKPNKENNKVFKTNLKNIPKPGGVVLTCKNLEFGYQKPLGEISLEIERGKKIGIIGANGSGKSTLLKTLSKIIPSISGHVNYGYNVIPAYFDQNLEFETNDTIIKEFLNKFPNCLQEEARSALGAFLFSGNDVDKNLNVLSGGEKVRLLLCEIFYEKTNLMFLDEPTNHLDIIGKNALEQKLKEYPETIIFISHDRYFVSELADELLVFEENTIKHYKYGYSEYKSTKQNLKIEEQKIKEVSKIKKEKPKTNPQNIKKLETEIEELNNKIEELNSELLKPEIYNDYQKSLELTNKINNLKEKLQEKEQKWLEIA